MLRQMTSKHQQDWDEHIDLATMAYRSTVHDSTGQTPNRMMLGRELPMPSYLLVETPEQDGRHDGTEPTFVDSLERRMQEAHELAREQLKRSHEHEHEPRPHCSYGRMERGEPRMAVQPHQASGEEPQADDLLGRRAVCHHRKSEWRSHENPTESADKTTHCPCG